MAVMVEGNVLEDDPASVRSCFGDCPLLRRQDGVEQLRASDGPVLAAVAPECDDALAPRIRPEVLPHLPANLDEAFRRGLRAVGAQQLFLHSLMPPIVLMVVRVVEVPAV
jgi:hypothetical protein